MAHTFVAAIYRRNTKYSFVSVALAIVRGERGRGGDALRCHFSFPCSPIACDALAPRRIALVVFVNACSLKIRLVLSPAMNKRLIGRCARKWTFRIDRSSVWGARWTSQGLTTRRMTGFGVSREILTLKSCIANWTLVSRRSDAKIADYFQKRLLAPGTIDVLSLTSTVRSERRFLNFRDATLTTKIKENRGQTSSYVSGATSPPVARNNGCSKFENDD